jgi:magnesium transporter
MTQPDREQRVATQIEDLPAHRGADVLRDLPRAQAAEVAEYLDPQTASQILTEMDPTLAASVVADMEPPEASLVLGAMDPDDRVDVLQRLPDALRDRLVAEMDPAVADEVRQLQQYPPDSAGGIMTTRVTALYEYLTVESAIQTLRELAEKLEQIYYVYVIDSRRHLVGVLSMRDLILQRGDVPLRDFMIKSVASVPVTMDQEEVARLLRRRGFVALPVTDARGRLAGQITADDVAHAVEEEATEDIQKLGGTEALDAPYMEVGFASMLRKRGGWLSVLFIGELLTATAMGYFEAEIARAVVLALFVPLIISSGGNSGSQAATIIVRALALSEVRARDWWRVLGRELRTSFTLGAWLGLLGFVRVVLWQKFHWMDYGPHYLRVATTLWISVTGVVTFGSVTGSMLPFLLRRLGFDPATSSAPFVATLVDVTGLVIYFTVAMLMLAGTML